jgi:hypothetical protein
MTQVQGQSVHLEKKTFLRIVMSVYEDNSFLNNKAIASGTFLGIFSRLIM